MELNNNCKTGSSSILRNKAPEKKYSQVDLEKLTLDYAHRRFHKHLIFQNITLSNWLQIKDH